MAPAVVIVSGLPAAGKSTLSRRLAADLGFTVVCRDRLAVASGLRDVQAQLPPDRWTMVPAAIDRIIDFMIEAVLDAGHGAVVDGNFNWREQREPVRALVERRRVPCAEVCLWGEPEVLKERFARRADPPMTEHLSQVFDVAVRRPREPVMGPPTPTIQFDTSDLAGFDAEYAALLETIRIAIGAESG